MPSPKPNETPEQREARLVRQRAYEARKREQDPDDFRRRANEAAKRYRERHPDKAKAAQAAWVSRPDNLEKVYASRRRRRDQDPLRFLFYRAKGNAKKRGIEFTITVADLPPIPERCPLLGHPLTRRGGQSNDPHLPSIDRIDPAKGYVPGNVWIVGYRANLIKNDGTAEEHEAIARAMRAALGG